MNCYEEKESMYREKELQRVHREGSLKRFCLGRTLNKETKCMSLWWKSDLGRGKTKWWEDVLGIQTTPKMWGNWMVRVSSVSSVAQSRLTLCNPMDCSTPGFPVHHQLLDLLKLMSVEPVMESNHLILCLPLLFLSSIFPSIRVFSSESVLHIKWPKYRSFRFSISPSKEYSGLISTKYDGILSKLLN